MAICSSILSWRIPSTEEPVGYHPWGLKESDVTELLSSSCRYPTLFSLSVSNHCPCVFLRPCNGPASSSLCPNAQPNLPCTPSQCPRGRASHISRSSLPLKETKHDPLLGRTQSRQDSGPGGGVCRRWKDIPCREL